MMIRFYIIIFFFLYLALGFALIKNRSKLNLSKPLAITSLVGYLIILGLIAYITLFFWMFGYNS
ncbi:hypothetical protein B7723_00130 [Streptococcus oralis subsp. oralis]|nr:hypothetical protein B7723_00130 [Streptococcus oralis subsp. oralis]